MLYADFNADEELVAALIGADVNQLCRLAELADKLHCTVDVRLPRGGDDAAGLAQPRSTMPAALRYYADHLPRGRLPTPASAAAADRPGIALEATTAPSGSASSDRSTAPGWDPTLSLAHAWRARLVITAAMQALVERPVYHEVRV